MSIKLMYITNQPEVARLAEQNGVDWIFVDLETVGKEKRQGHLDTVRSKHTLDDVKVIKASLTSSKLLVRSNPIYDSSREELDNIVRNGADVVMLPYFKTVEEVRLFLEAIGKRAETCLLLETPEAVNLIDDILDLDGIDYIHIGLNDLHLGYGLNFMFELLTDGTVERLVKKIKAKNIPFGFGGIAQLRQGALPAEKVIGEHYRLGSSMAILSRSFCDMEKCGGLDHARKIFNAGVQQVRDFENTLITKEEDWFQLNRNEVEMIVENIKLKLQGVIISITEGR